MEQETKKCPYCGEEIMATAKKCKHCGEWLESVQSVTDESNEPENVNEVFEQTVEEAEVLSTREKVCLGFLYIGCVRLCPWHFW